MIGVIDLDWIIEICVVVGVGSFNFDFLGSSVFFVILDNYVGVCELIFCVFRKCEICFGGKEFLFFVGGCGIDYNMSECFCGFCDVYEVFGVLVDEYYFFVCGYVLDKVVGVFCDLKVCGEDLFYGFFVNLIIFLEGVMCWMIEMGYYGER